MKVNIKRLNENAVIPNYAKHGDAGMDLTATSKSYDDHGNVVYGTGLALEIPIGYVGYVFPRSSNAKKDLILSNSVGVIDSGYRGEVVLKFKRNMNVDKFECAIKTHNKFITLDDHQVGNRIGQIIIMPVPHIEFNGVDELSSTDRGTGGFGSADPITKSIESNFTP